MRVARADRLHLAGVLAVGRRQRHAAGHDDGGQVAAAGQRHQHRGQALVAGRDADHRPARRQRADQPPQHDRGVVAVRQAVHHARRALRAAVARIGDEAGERDAAAPRAASRAAAAHEQADLPVPRVVAERERACRRGARTPPCVLRISTSGRPSSAGCQPMPDVLRPAEEVAARAAAADRRRSSGSAPAGPGCARARRRRWTARRFASGSRRETAVTLRAVRPVAVDEPPHLAGRFCWRARAAGGAGGRRRSSAAPRSAGGDAGMPTAVEPGWPVAG